MCWRSFTDWGFYVPKSWDLKFSHFQKTFVNKVSLAFKSNSQFMAIVLSRACFRPKAWDSEEIFAGQKRHLVLASLAMDLGARSQGCVWPMSFSKASWFWNVSNYSTQMQKALLIRWRNRRRVPESQRKCRSAEIFGSQIKNNSKKCDKFLSLKTWKKVSSQIKIWTTKPAVRWSHPVVNFYHIEFSNVTNEYTTGGVTIASFFVTQE